MIKTVDVDDEKKLDLVLAQWGGYGSFGGAPGWGGGYGRRGYGPKWPLTVASRIGMLAPKDGNGLYSVITKACGICLP